ncbi:MAG: hypothetical protein M5U12_05620 [Verrucomicrobia bacterium]|nr:hypothetical protein [Verrucomicrobiota bacterium]
MRTVPPRSQMNLVPFASYEELRQDFIANPMRQALRAQRRQETTARWNLARNQRQPVLRLTPGEITDALAGEPVTQARADGDEDEEPVVTVSVLRNGGIRLTALREGSQLLRVRLEDGRVAHHTVVVTTSARLSPTLHGGECAHIRERNWYAGQGWHVDQCQYDQLHRDEWCPAVGCGPTALAMLLGWWDVHGVPSAFYRLRSGAGSTGAFRFEFPSVYGPDAP